MYECVRVITQIYPSTQLLEEAAAAISTFITSDNHNLKYLGSEMRARSCVLALLLPCFVSFFFSRSSNGRVKLTPTHVHMHNGTPPLLARGTTTGINSLASIVQINPKYAADHQLIVIDCLEDTDETLRRKTMELLYSMTNPQNVVFIVGKLLDSLKVRTYVRARVRTGPVSRSVDG